MQQLVQPNLGASGEIAMCEEFAERVWHSTVTRPTAIVGWNAIPAQYKHTGEPPVGVAVQMYWLYEEDGHTATADFPRGILSSPWEEGTTQAWLTNRAELEQIYSDNGKYPLTYLGWTEYFNGVLVAQEEDMALTPTEIDMAFKLAGVTDFQEDLANQDYANDAGLLIRTLFNAAGARPASTSPTPTVVVDGKTYIPKS